MDFNIEVRKKQLESLDQYISSSKDKVQSVLDCLGWSGDKILEEDERIACFCNNSHLIHPKAAVEHIQKCQIRKEGYNLDEQFLSEPQNNPEHSVKIDHEKKIQILTEAQYRIPQFKTAWNGLDPDPRTSDRLFSTYSSDERLVLYNFCTENTTGPSTLPDFNVLNENGDSNKNKVLSESEIKAMVRDAKRRQVKYKSVHTNRKTHTEIMKQVIDGLMVRYEDWLTEKPSKAADTFDDVSKNIEQKLVKEVDAPKENHAGCDDSRNHYEEYERCPSANSRHSYSGSLKSNQSRHMHNNPQIEFTDKRYKRNRSPSEYSNASSSKSKRRDRDDSYSYASTSRHSSLESLGSKYKHREKEYKTHSHSNEQSKTNKRCSEEYKTQKHFNEDYESRQYSSQEFKNSRNYEDKYSTDKHSKEYYKTHRDTNEYYKTHRHLNEEHKTPSHSKEEYKICIDSNDYKIHRDSNKDYKTHRDSNKDYKTHRNSNEDYKTHRHPNEEHKASRHSDEEYRPHKEYKSQRRMKDSKNYETQLGSPNHFKEDKYYRDKNKYDKLKDKKDNDTQSQRGFKRKDYPEIQSYEEYRRRKFSSQVHRSRS